MSFSKFAVLFNKHREKIFVGLISLVTYLFFFGKFLLPNYYFWFSDVKNEYLPARVYFYEKVVKEFTFPFWTEKMYSGFPIYADAENGYLNPINILSILIFGPAFSYKVLHLIFYLLGSVSLYLILKRKNLGLLGFAVANVVFFFNTFQINHQIHFNIILTFYLLPVGIYLVDLYLENPRLRYIVLESIIISFGILYGHIQSSILFCVAVGLYYLIFAGKKLFSKAIIAFGVLLSLAILFQTLPQVLPAKELYDLSKRESSLDFYQGSFYPNMVSFVFLPYQFGEKKDYRGSEIHYSYSYTEVYVYLGLGTFLFFIFGLLFLKTNQITLYAYVTFWIFLVFAIIRYNNFFNEDTPIVSVFRHWQRTFILFSFGASLMAAYFVENLQNLNFKRIYLRIIYIVAPIYYLYYYFKLTPKSVALGQLNEILSWASIQLTKDFWVLKTIFIGCFVILLISILLKSKNNLKIISILKILAVIFVIGDLFYFAKDVTNYRLVNYSYYNFNQIPQKSPKERSVYFNYNLMAMEYVYLDSWSPFGYSQFSEKKYVSFLKKNNLPEGGVGNLEKALKKPNNTNLEQFGITTSYKTTLEGEFFEKISNKKIDLIKGDFEGTYITKEEGNISFNLKTPHDEVIETFIKYTPNWVLTIDGKPSSFEPNGVFLKFNLSAGEHAVTFKYVPYAFYEGLKYSLLAFLVFLGFAWVFKKYKFLS